MAFYRIEWLGKDEYTGHFRLVYTDIYAASEEEAIEHWNRTYRDQLNAGKISHVKVIKTND